MFPSINISSNNPFALRRGLGLAADGRCQLGLGSEWFRDHVTRFATCARRWSFCLLSRHMSPNRGTSTSVHQQPSLIYTIANAHQSLALSMLSAINGTNL